MNHIHSSSESTVLPMEGGMVLVLEKLKGKSLLTPAPLQINMTNLRCTIHHFIMYWLGEKEKQPLDLP